MNSTAVCEALGRALVRVQLVNELKTTATVLGSDAVQIFQLVPRLMVEACLASSSAKERH